MLGRITSIANCFINDDNPFCSNTIDAIPGATRSVAVRRMSKMSFVAIIMQSKVVESHALIPGTNVARSDVSAVIDIGHRFLSRKHKGI